MPIGTPSLTDELARKALEVIDSAVQRQKAAEITENELRGIVLAVYDTISGLVDRATQELVWRCAKEITCQPFVQRDVFVNDEGRCRIIEHPLGTNVVCYYSTNKEVPGTKWLHQVWEQGDNDPKPLSLINNLAEATRRAGFKDLA